VEGTAAPAGAGYFGKLGSGVSNMLGFSGGGAGATAGQVVSGAGRLAPGSQAIPSSSLGNAGSMFLKNPMVSSGGPQSFSSTMLSSLSEGAAGAGGGLGSVLSAGSTATEPAKKGLLELLGLGGGKEGGGGIGSTLLKTGLGAAIPMIGNMFGKDKEQQGQESVFDQSQLTQEVLSRVRSGTQQPLSEGQRDALTANYDEQYEGALDNLKERWKGLRPGSDLSNDSQFQEMNRELENEFATKKANALTMAQFGFTQKQTENLAQVAQLEGWDIARQSGISTQEAQDFKKFWADLGLAVATS